MEQLRHGMWYGVLMKMRDGSSMADKTVMAVYIALQDVRHSHGRAGLKEALKAAKTGSSDAKYLDEAYLLTLDGGKRMHPVTRKIVKLAVTSGGDLQEPWKSLWMRSRSTWMMMWRR